MAVRRFARWRFILARSYDLKPYGELTQARQRQLSLQLNRAGNASFVMPMDGELSELIWPIEAALLVYRTGSTGTQLIWSGYVNTIDEDVTNNRMTVNCVGWFERLNKFFLRARVRYGVSGVVDNGFILYDLLDRANGDPPSASGWSAGTNSFTGVDSAPVSWPAGSAPNVPTWILPGDFQPNEGVGGLTAYTTAGIAKDYEPWQNIGQAITDLTEVENGPDFNVEPDTRRLNIFRKRRRILTGVVFGYNWGPANISQFSRQLDGSTVVNYHRTTGLPNVIGQAVFDTPSALLYGTLAETTALSDVGEPNVLLTYSQAEVAIRKVPRTIYSITPFAWTPDNSSPEPFVEYRVGDQVLFRAVKEPRVSISQQVRIFGMQVGIDEEGNERLGQLQLYPGG